MQHPFNFTPQPFSQEDPEKRQLERDADFALAARGENGGIIPILPTGPGPLADAIGQIYYPAAKPDENGCIQPILFDRDFAGGKLPSYMEYIPGWERPDHPYDGKTLDGIVYCDPVKNLPPREQEILRQARNVLPTPPQPVGEGYTEPPVSLWTCPVRPTFQGMIAQTRNGDELLSNFVVRPTARRVIKQRGVPDAEEFQLEVVCGGEHRMLTIAASDLENVVPKIIRAFPACHTDADASKASVRIANAIRDQISTLPTVTVVKSTGFIRVCGQWYFAHDSALVDGPVEFRTGYTIPCDPQISPRQALQAALGVLELAPKSPSMWALLLVGHLGLLYNIFEAAGIPPQFVTLLLGQTGSFKTSTALALFRPFPELPKTPEATFRDTKTALEVKIGAACSRALIIDDFQPAVTSAAGKEMLEKIEFIIRLFGDGVAKSRSNSELGRAKEFHPAGCCLITGEDRGGSHSSLLRCLVLSVQKGEIFGDRLKFFYLSG